MILMSNNPEGVLTTSVLVNCNTGMEFILVSQLLCMNTIVTCIITMKCGTIGNEFFSHSHFWDATIARSPEAAAVF